MPNPIVSLTDVCNGLHGKHIQEFAITGRSINRQDDYFCYADYPELTEGNYRQLILRLRPILVCEIKGKPCYYRFRDEKTTFDRDDLTYEGMVVGTNMDKILRDVKIQPPAIHNIKLMFSTKQLYPQFIKTGKYNVDPHNGGVFLPKVRIERHIEASVTLYPSKTIIDIGCTYKPIVYDTKGALKLIGILQQIYSSLIIDTNGEALDIPHPLNWIVTNYHFNRDSKEEFSGATFNRTFEDFAGGIIRYYCKEFPDGKRKLRQERIKSPNCSVEDEIKNMHRADKFLYSNEKPEMSQEEVANLLKKVGGMFDS